VSRLLCPVTVPLTMPPAGSDRGTSSTAQHGAEQRSWVRPALRRRHKVALAGAAAAAAAARVCSAQPANLAWHTKVRNACT
jgi:hypothetical protein